MTQGELYEQFLAGAGKLGWKAERADLPNITGTVVLPLQQDVFKALEAIPPKKVKYLVLGQDPYPTKSNGVPDATGIAFAVRQDRVDVPKSLRRIMNKIYADGVGCPDLKEWRERHSVLLLNAALTVEENDAGSHMHLWKKFTLSVIRQAKDANPDVQLVAWGRDATEILIEALNMFTWCHHPVARKGGERSFSQFWDTPVGIELGALRPESRS